MDQLPDSFRCAMRGLASTVCLVTARTSAGPRGMTATAVMSLSVDPPALALAVNRSARLNPELAAGASLCVQLLSEDQDEIARAFAGGLPPDERFSVGAWNVDRWGSPVLATASASLSGTVEQRVELATHSLLVIGVREVRLAPDARPLLYAHGGFTGLRDAAARCAA